MATATSMDYVQKIFVAYLGRGASTEALEYWGNLIDADETTGKDALFFNIWSSAEAVALYKDMDSAAIITLIFQNAFERDPAAEGITYWEGEIEDGSVNVVSLAAAIVDAADTAGAATYGYKISAADYYRTEMDDAGKDFVPDQSKQAIDSVDSPNSLEASKDITDAIASNTGLTLALTAGDDTAALQMTAADDTITGKLGAGATYDITGATDTIADSYTLDSDTLTLSSDAPLTGTQGTIVMGTVTKVETVNVNFDAQLGTTLSLNMDKVDAVADLNVDVNPLVTVAGISNVPGATVVSITNNKSDVSATDVTNLTVGMNDTHNTNDAVTVSADADATTVAVTGIDDAGVTITLANDTAVALTVGGGDGTNDFATISANNAVALATGGTVDKLSLSGNTNDVNYTLTGADANSQYTITGEHDVTLTGAAASFSTATLTDSSSGTITVNVTGADALDLTGVDADVVQLSADFAGDTITFNDSQDVTISSAQNITTFAQGNGNDGTVAITVDMGTASTIADLDLVATHADKVTVNAQDITVTAGGFLGTANDTDFTLVGTNDITFNGAINIDDGDATVSGKALNLALITANAVDVDASNDATLAGVTASGGVDIDAVGNFVNAAAAIAGGSGAGNDVSISANTINMGAQALTGDDITLDAANDTAASAIGAVTAANDVTLAGGNLDVTGSIAATAGSVTVSGGDVDVSANVTGATGVTVSGGDLAGAIIKATTGQLTISGTGGYAATTTSAVGGVLITSANDVDLGTLADDTSVINGGGASGDISVTTIATTGNVSTIVTGTGDDNLTLAGDDYFSVQSGDGNDTVNVTGVLATSVINTGAGDDIVAATDAGVAYVLSTGDGNDTITVADASDASIDAGGGTGDTVKLAAGSSFLDDTLSISNAEVVQLLGTSAISAAQFEGIEDAELTGNFVLTITDTTATASTIDASGLEFDLNAVTTLAINGNDGDDTITGSESVDTITGGGGNDTISGGAGNDVVVLAATGTDTVLDFASGDKLNLDAATAGGLAGGVIIAEAADNVVTGALVVDTAYGFTTNGAAGSLHTSGSATITDFTNDTQIAAFLSEKYTTKSAGGAGAKGLFVITDSVSGETYIYAHVEDNTNGIVAGELTLIGVVNDYTVLSADVL